MLKKQAVWRQCSCVPMAILAVATVVSTQQMTWQIDLYWSIVLLAATLFRFVDFEHVTLFHISTDIWSEVRHLCDRSLKIAMVSWLMFSTISSWWLLLHLPICAALAFLKQNVTRPFLITTVMLAIYSPSILTFSVVTFAGLGFWLRSVSVIGKSIASREQRQRVAIVSSLMLFETLILWQIRCQHRFPHVFRWRPIIVGLIAVVSTIVWCIYNVRDTVLSHNAVIQCNGHGITASQEAAMRCKTCSSCITSLDMEASF